MELRTVIVDALEKRYEAQLAEADATLKIYFENSVGIGEHPQHVDEVDKLISKVAQAEENLRVLRQYRWTVFQLGKGRAPFTKCYALSAPGGYIWYP